MYTIDKQLNYETWFSFNAVDEFRYGVTAQIYWALVEKSFWYSGFFFVVCEKNVYAKTSLTKFDSFLSILSS